MATKNELENALEDSPDKSFFFPDNLAEIDHWMAFRINDHILANKHDFPIQKDRRRIFLPLPENLGTQYTHNYANEGIGVAGMAGANHGRAIYDSLKNRDIDAVVDKIGSIGKREALAAGQYYGLQAAQNNIASVVAAAITGIGGGVAAIAATQFLKGAVAGEGLALNPYMATMYEGTAARVHSFSWKFIPKSRKESMMLRDIIYLFKYHSAPGINKENTHFFDYPQQFDIDFHYPEYLYNIGPSVLTNFEVNYHGEGKAIYHNIQAEDDLGATELLKAPVSVVINANFQEVAIVSKETIDSQNR